MLRVSSTHLPAVIITMALLSLILALIPGWPLSQIIAVAVALPTLGLSWIARQQHPIPNRARRHATLGGALSLVALVFALGMFIATQVVLHRATKHAENIPDEFRRILHDLVKKAQSLN